MGFKRLRLSLLCMLGVFASASAVAHAGAPRWYGKATGSLVPISGTSGLSELTSPETLHSAGQVKVVSSNFSECLVKDRETVEDPSNVLLPGTGQMEEFEVVCEEGTGPGLNAAAPFPCVTVGEAFELTGINLNWQSTLEVGGAKHNARAAHRAGSARARRRAHGGRAPRRGLSVRALPVYFDKFTDVEVEVNCLQTKEHAVYKGTLKPEVEVGRLRFLGPESGELEEPTSGSHFYLKGNDWLAPDKYKDIRVNSEYHEAPAIASLTPNSGPAAGGTSVAVAGSGFALGTGTIFDFGKAAGSSVECTSTTECTVTAPPGKAGKVDVVAIVGTTKSTRNRPGDQYTYQ